MRQTLHEQVQEFHYVADLPVRCRPQIPSDDEVRLRLRIFMEEVFELLFASFAPNDERRNLYEARNIVDECINGGQILVNLPAFVDAQADIDYINEGTRLVFGTYYKPIADEVHRTNMAKFPLCSMCGGREEEPCPTCKGKRRITIRREDGKVLKPEGWKPPNIEHCLMEQGWNGR